MTPTTTIGGALTPPSGGRLIYIYSVCVEGVGKAYLVIYEANRVTYHYPSFQPFT